MTQLETLPVTYQQLKTATNHDPILGQVVQCIRNGWPVAAVEELKPYVARKLELTLQDDCVLWGTRVVTKETAGSYSGGTTQGSCWYLSY